MTGTVSAADFAALVARFDAQSVQLNEAFAQMARLPGPHVPPPKIKVPRIPSFAGERESDLEPWLSQARSIISASEGLSLDTPVCVTYASLFLEKKARTVWDHRVRETGDLLGNCACWNDFAALLKKLLGPSNTDITGRAKLRELRQTGSVHSYLDHFLRLARSLETAMHDLDLREFFIGGLKSEVQQYVRQQFPATFHEAQTASTLYDSTFYRKAPSSSQHHRSSSSQYNQRSSSRGDPMDLGAMEARGRSASRSSSRGPSRSPSAHRSKSPAGAPPRLATLTTEERARCMKDGLCFRCRKPGHTSSSCPLARRRPSTPARKN